MSFMGLQCMLEAGKNHESMGKEWKVQNLVYKNKKRFEGVGKTGSRVEEIKIKT